MKNGVFENLERVLVRDWDTDYWVLTAFSNYTDDTEYPFRTWDGQTWRQCIPFEGNAALRGTDNSPGPWVPRNNMAVSVSKDGVCWYARILKAQGYSGKYFVTFKNENSVEDNVWKYCEPFEKHFTFV